MENCKSQTFWLYPVPKSPLLDEYRLGTDEEKGNGNLGAGCSARRDGHSEVVQSAQGVWFHHARRRRQGFLRPHDRHRRRQASISVPRRQGQIREVLRGQERTKGEAGLPPEHPEHGGSASSFEV